MVDVKLDTKSSIVFNCRIFRQYCKVGHLHKKEGGRGEDKLLLVSVELWSIFWSDTIICRKGVLVSVELWSIFWGELGSLIV